MERQLSTETLAESPNSLVEIQGLAFTIAGVVTGEEALQGRSSTSSSVTGGIHFNSSTPMTTGSAMSATTTKGGGLKLQMGFWKIYAITAAIMMLHSVV